MTATPAADMPRAYNAADVEQRIYQDWLEQGLFAPSQESDQTPYCIIMPPPNVTGELHLGHALEKSLEDSLIRWRRMCGVPTLWLPGTDHAGIATQWAVERELAAQGQDRHQLGRERFVELVWEHVRKYGGIIHEQSRRLGISADWDRHRFTLDPGPSKAVRTTFVNLYNKGRIYRHERIINWCPRCATALSDLEVSYQEQDDKLYFIRYPLAEAGAGTDSDSIAVATTRPETMLGDTGVAVNPEDSRYRDLVGSQVVLPIMDRPIPVVADEAIQQEFGTGALKVTPGHDPVDFEIGQRHGLEIITVIGLDGNMTAAAGKYAGMERFQTRESVVAELESLGLLERVEDLQHSVGHCQRCDSVVEPLVSLQWFINVGSHQDPDSIAGRAHAAVKNGDIQIVPERFGRVYLNWLENIRDWCISRQLWWGHRIPVWYCDGCGQASASIEDLESCPSCGSAELHQDPDVLDTWFSSGLWPHSTLGWPDNTDDLRRFYPTTVLECGYDILFFWVARMIMMGIENTGQVPFRTVFLHGLIRDASGAKMSKTRGNTLDPLELVERYGTDALRFALTTGTAPGNDMRITDGKLEAARNFANKVWNAARYVISTIGSQSESQEGVQAQAEGWRDLPNLEHREDRWIVSLLDRLAVDVNQSLESFELGEAQQRLYEFFWNDFCDWYIEMAKIRLRSGIGQSPLPTLAHVLERTLRLMHPFMPFITEEIWRNLIARLPPESEKEGRGESQRLGSMPESVMVADYPRAPRPRIDGQAEEEIALIIQAIRAVRNTRSQLRIPAGQQLEAVIEANGASGTTNTIKEAIQEEADVIRSLSRVEPLHIQDQNSGTDAGTETGIEKPSKGITLVVNPLVIRLTLEGVADLSTEENRLKGELDGSLKNLQRVEALVSDPNFKTKAKPEVVENEEERLRSLREETQRLEEILAQLSAD